MKKNVKAGIVGFLFISILGVLGHFAYGWLGQIPWTGLFFPVNESIWEHLKLLFYPATVWWGIEWYRGSRSPGFFPIRMWSLALAMGAVPVLYYTYSGVIGQRFAAVDMGIFFLCVGLYFWFCSLFSKGKRAGGEGETVFGLMLFLTVLFSFWIFTFFPPDLGIFWEP